MGYLTSGLAHSHRFQPAGRKWQSRNPLVWFLHGRFCTNTSLAGPGGHVCDLSKLSSGIRLPQSMMRMRCYDSSKEIIVMRFVDRGDEISISRKIFHYFFLLFIYMFLFSTKTFIKALPSTRSASPLLSSAHSWLTLHCLLRHITSTSIRMAARDTNPNTKTAEGPSRAQDVSFLPSVVGITLMLPRYFRPLSLRRTLLSAYPASIYPLALPRAKLQTVSVNTIERHRSLTLVSEITEALNRGAGNQTGSGAAPDNTPGVRSIFCFALDYI